MDPAVHPVDVVRVDLQAGAVARDVAATEEPLEIRLGGRPFVVIMRTPGEDRHLAAGFLLSEQIVRAPGDISAMRYCTEDDGRDAANVLNVWLDGDAAVRAQAALEGRRHVTANSACGVCGRRTIDDLLEGSRRVEAALKVFRAVIAGLPAALRAAQQTLRADRRAARGRAVQRRRCPRARGRGRGPSQRRGQGVRAELLAGRVPLGDRMLFVSGRTSFEIIQKAVVAGVPVVASVSAPSSLAIDARPRGERDASRLRSRPTFNIYSAAGRIEL